VLIANSLLVPRWATPEHFRELEDAGLMMYGQMTAGSWIYIGTQGILQGTYATFTEVAEQHFGGTLAGTITLTGGLGGMGGAQPLAVTGNGGAALCIEVDPWRARRRLDHGYLDEVADSLDDGIARVEAAKRERRALSVAVVANCADVLPELVRRGWSPDVVTDQTSAHDELNGYVPNGMTLEEALELRSAKPQEYVERSRAAMAEHCRAMVDLGRAGAVVFDYGNGLRGQAKDAGFADAFSYPGFVVAYIRPLFARGAGPFRWACLSGSPADLAATDEAVLKAFPDDDGLQRWVRFAAVKVKGQGLPSRICWVGYGERHRAGQAFDDLVRSGAVEAPIVIGLIISTPGRSPHPSVRPRRCATEPTRSPTGRSSTRCSTPRPAPPGSPCTTAGESASASRSTPAWWSWPRAPTRRTRSSPGSSPTTPAPASCATPTRATRSPSRPPARSASGSRCSTAPTPRPGSPDPRLGE